jgi:hypothetical protein
MHEYSVMSDGVDWDMPTMGLGRPVYLGLVHKLVVFASVSIVNSTVASGDNLLKILGDEKSWGSRLQVSATKLMTFLVTFLNFHCTAALLV